MQVEDIGPRVEDYYDQHQKPEDWRKKPEFNDKQAIPGRIGYAARFKKLLKRFGKKK